MHQNQETQKKDLNALIIGFALILIVAGYFVGRSFFHGTPEETTDPTDSVAQNTLTTLSPQVVHQKILNRENIRLIDIRTADDFDQSHIPHASSVPIGTLPGFTPEKDQTIVIVYDPSDPAPLEAAKNIFEQKSFSPFVLDGGLPAWLSAGYPVLSAGDPTSFLDQSKVTYINAADLKKLIENEPNLYLLDIQQSGNYEKKHIKGAVHIPLSALENRSQDIPKGKNIVVYGENDLISFQGGVRLSDLGFPGVRTLDGKQNLEPASGLPLEP